MSENPDESLSPKQLVYQVVATRLNEQHGQALRARLGSKPFLIGSGKSANMLLDNPQILTVQIRLLSSTSGQMLLTNLGDDENVLMNGEPVPTLVPTYWKPGLAVTLADFELQLVTLLEAEGEGQVERVRPAVITQASEVAPESDSVAGFVIDWGDSRDEAVPEPESPDNNTVLFDKNADVVDDDLEALIDTREGWRLETPSQQELPEPSPPPASSPAFPDPPPPVLPEIPRLEESGTLPTEAMPTGLNLAQGGQSPYTGAKENNETLPKNWQSAGKLSAQLTSDSVNLVAGERVRIPVSARNEGDNPMHLRVHIAGLPKDWTATLQRDETLAPGEIKSIDVILETKAPFDQAYLDTLLRIHDQLSPDAYLTLPLYLNFKNVPNVVGRLSPTQLTAPQTVYLNLHNHTQVTISVVVVGHSESTDLHIVPSAAQLDLPPGQSIEIPVNVQVVRRTWFRGSRYRFSVSVRHGNRAALDYPGLADVRPHISLAFLLLAAILIIALLVAWRLFGTIPAASVSTATPAATSSLPIIVDQTSLPTEQAEETQEIRAVSSPQTTPTSRPTLSPTRPPTMTPRPTNTVPPTATPFPTITLALTDILPTPTSPSAQAILQDDPRPSTCSVAIPEGWKSYTVQSGDRVFRLAVTYNTTVDEVVRVNCLVDARILQVGQILLLPLP